MERPKPLNLLDLPVDVLKEIIRELPHTNDLTSLALTHSALHALAIPLIYSRFDIVWPDGHTTTDNRTGVDALTYGLSTLVMGKEVFGEAPSQKLVPNHVHKCECGRVIQFPSPQSPQTPQKPHKPQNSVTQVRKTRRGNDYAQYTRKFSLGNGPADWVQEYLITKEGGKMLGTLVAHAVGRMRNLETFIWDMPTGVLRDVWLALGSLADRDDGHESRLERVWVRWHDNTEASSTNPTLISATQPATHPLAGNSLPTSLFHIPPYPRVEFPTFSILPPLKSLSVLDIDELPYVQEMSLLIQRSISKLRELRVGLAFHAQFDQWACLPGDKDQVISPSTDSGPAASDGVLGILFNRLADVPGGGAGADSHVFDDSLLGSTPDPRQTGSYVWPSNNAIKVNQSPAPVQESQENTIFDTMPITQDTSESAITPVASLGEKMEQLVTSFNDQKITESFHSQRDSSPPLTPPSQSLKLQLEVLELERVSLSVPVLSRSIDWTVLTSLTILGCRHHDQLWRALRKRFNPRSSSGTNPSTPQTPVKSPRTPTTPKFAFAAEDYPLKLKRLHTDCVSATLIAFLKETLAPDSLEWLFLQEHRGHSSGVTIEQIYRGPLRRHRASLKKVLIDSLEHVDPEAAAPAVTLAQNRRWALSREALNFILSGRMFSLRELSITLDYKDWHFFLQRLPCIPHLRSLFIPHVSEHVHGRHPDSRELALQVLDVVALRPELELCYLGIQTKCFEILEYPAGHKPSTADLASASHGYGVGVDSSDDDEDHLTNDSTVEHNPLAEDEDGGSENESARGEDVDSDDDLDDDRLAHRGNRATKVFKLREILFYDDKVSIFKARHGKL